jgi:hypothetical protein
LGVDEQFVLKGAAGPPVAGGDVFEFAQPLQMGADLGHAPAQLLTLVEGHEPELLLHPGFMSSRKKLQASFDAFLEELTQEHEKNPYKNVRLVRSKDAIELAIKISQNPV